MSLSRLVGAGRGHSIYKRSFSISIHQYERPAHPPASACGRHKDIVGLGRKHFVSHAAAFEVRFLFLSFFTVLFHRSRAGSIEASSSSIS